MIFGIGFNDVPGKTYGPDNKQDKSYIAWLNMLKRCYDEKFLEKHPTYRGCKVCQAWLNYSTFKRWFDENYKPGYEIDKDVLCRYYGITGVYSPATCRFVPHRLNSLFIRVNAVRGEYPVGVSYNVRYKKFEVHIRNNGGRELLGYYDDPKVAFLVYKKAFREKVRIVAIDAFKRGEIDEEYRDAMLAYDVTEND